MGATFGRLAARAFRADAAPCRGRARRATTAAAVLASGMEAVLAAIKGPAVSAEIAKLIVAGGAP